MRFALVIAASGALAATGFPDRNRAFGGKTGIVANEFEDGGCKETIFFFARASTEIGNMGASVGPLISDGLKKELGNGFVATQGVDYEARLETNSEPGGADPIGISQMQKLLQEAHCRCPKAKIVAAGYSQGAALMHRAIEDRTDDVKSQIVGVVTLGDTQNQQDHGEIPNFPKNKVLIICNEGDLVCKGTKDVRAPHFQYTGRTSEAVDFLVKKIKDTPGTVSNEARSC